MTTLIGVSPLVGQVYHHYPNFDSDTKAYVWEVLSAEPFDEMMITWNAFRPIDGDYLISVMIQTEDWSPWMLYMHWGENSQWSQDLTDNDLKIYQDGILVLNGKKGTAFRVRMEATGEANLGDLWAIHTFTDSTQGKEIPLVNAPLKYLHLHVPPISQMALEHPRAISLCSPTSTTAVLNYLKSGNVDPLGFAENVLDANFDIYGNWVLNMAQAANEIGKDWECWVQKANDFGVIFENLEKKIPVVVSIRGPLAGSQQAYASGHLVVVKGYDPIGGEVLCMDPAYPTDEETLVAYPLADFVAAWMRRGQVVYLFNRR